MAPVEMTRVGWIFMLVAWTVIGGLTLWCFYKLVTTGPGDGGGDDHPE